MLWLYKFICGYLYVEFYGDFSEKILNICAKNRISLWNSRCIKRRIRSSIKARDFKKLPEIARGNKIRVHILKKVGLPFYIKRYKSRVGFTTGFIMFFAFLKFMSCFVWSIEICGNKEVSAKEIISACNSIGIYEGILKSKIDPKVKKQQLLLNVDSLAWASINIEGCCLTVNVTEVQKKTVDNKQATNLKAAADGIITKIDVISGNCIVKVGQTVKKGDILVSGIIERENSTQFVHSLGHITAKTERSITASGDYKKEVKRYTGSVKKKSVLNFFGYIIPLYLGKYKGEYTAKTNCTRLKLLGKELPISLYTKKFQFTENIKITLSKNELLNELENTIKNQLKEINITEYEVIQRTVSETENGLKLSLIVTAQEDIAYQDILLFSSGN